MEKKDGMQTFQKHWKMPRSEVNRIKKEFETARAATASINPDSLKCFKDMAEEVFDFFEQLTGKKSNREVILGHLSYYFNEGFEEEEMKQYISKQFFESDYYKAHREWFTIANLFPIKDQDRINTVWDLISFHQSEKNKISVEKVAYLDALKLRLKCGHSVFMKDYRASSFTCPECLRGPLLLQILENPHEAILSLTDSPFLEIAEWFCKRGEESPDEYVQRTYSKRKEVMESLGMKCPPLTTLSDTLKVGAATPS